MRQHAKTFAILLILTLIATASNAQSRRVQPTQPTDSDGTAGSMTVKAMFEEVSDYTRKAFLNFAQKKVPYSDELREQTEREQRELAAKYASETRGRQDLSDEDRYYLGMLFWIAEKYPDSSAELEKFVSSAQPKDDLAQTARSVLVVIGAKIKKFDPAERHLADYLKAEPIRYKDVFRMESELCASYLDSGDVKRAALHGEAALKAAKWLFGDAGTRSTAVDQLLEAGLTLFGIYKSAGEKELAVKALEDLRSSAVYAESSVAYFLGTDELVKFLIDIGEKKRGIQVYRDAVESGYKSFLTEIAREDAVRRLSRREKHYAMLGEDASELVDVRRSINGPTKSLQELRGKVVLLDFWAPWCGPCLDAFPSLIRWNEEFKADLEIVGLTRYYGLAGGQEVSASKEFDYLVKFTSDNRLPYSIFVSDGIANQLRYDAMNLPTTVLIDRKGKVRYIEIGTSAARLSQLRLKIEELIAERH